MIHFKNPDTAKRLREAIDKGGYSDQAIGDRLATSRLATPGPRENVYGLECTREMTPVDVLIRLLFLGVGVKAGDVRAVLTPELVDAGIEAGLFVEEQGDIRCQVMLMSHAGFLLATDGYRREGWDRVMTLGMSSTNLAGLTIRRHSRLTLDLGCGSGVQSFLAAPHSDRVIGIDANPRAVEMARLGAQLNGLSNVEFIVGDWLKPVQGLQFDLVVSNPPFVISPGKDLQFRDSGRGDSLCRELTKTVPEILADGGFFQMYLEWMVPAGQKWEERVAGWVDKTGCDSWLLKHDVISPARYARIWTADAKEEEIEERFLAWLRNVEALGASAIGQGALTMRKRSGGVHWFRAQDAPREYMFPAGDSILAHFLLRDYLDSIENNDQALLSERLKLSPDARLHQAFVQSGTKMETISAELTLVRGIPYQTNVDPMTMGLFARCDGNATVAELLAKMSEATGTKLKELTPTTLTLLRSMVAQGFLLPEVVSNQLSALKVQDAAAHKR